MSALEKLALLGLATIAVACNGCGAPFAMMSTSERVTEPTGVTSEVAARALIVGEQIGGPDGFGGTRLNGFMNHMQDWMGFQTTRDLAADGETMTLTLSNQSTQPCTFYVTVLRSTEGLDPTTTQIFVPAEQTTIVEMPCAEIVNLGSLSDVGAAAAEFEDGLVLDNRMCVPGFLGSDFVCGGTYGVSLIVDVQDLDADGDTSEVIAVTDGLSLHTGRFGMMGHGHMQAARP
jgi:hypothetical protein